MTNMENLTKEELKRIKDILTMPAKNAEDAKQIAREFLEGCSKKNPSVDGVNEKKAGMFNVNISYDREFNNEQDYRYVYGKK